MLILPRKSRPSFASGFARNASQARYPQVWDGLSFANDYMLGSTGLSTYDVSGRGNTGTLTNMNGSNWGPNGLTFDGASEYVDIGSLLDFGTGIFSFFIRTVIEDIDSFPISSRSSSSTKGYEFLMGGNSTSGRAELRWQDDSNHTDVGQTNGLDDGSPHALCGVFDSQFGSFFVDGEFKGQAARNGSIDNSQSLRLASRGASFWSGTITVAAIYNRVLDPSEIQLLYTHPQAITQRRARQFAVASGAAANYYQIDWGHGVNSGVGVGAGQFGKQVI